jgi:hypothetical protein
MKARIREFLARPWWRIALAATLLLVGVASVGLPILSDQSWRQQPQSEAGAAMPVAQPFQYQWGVEPGGTTRIERSEDGGRSWSRVAAVPRAILDLQAVRGFENLVFARTEDGIWGSEDGGASWAETTGLPSRPQTLAISHETPGVLFVGTESMGLLRSNDRGASWQIINDPNLLLGGAGALAITALTINPDDEQTMYAASGVWLGTFNSRLSPLGVFVSLNGGYNWFEMAQAPLGASNTTTLKSVPGNPGTVMAEDSDGWHAVRLVWNEQLTNALGSTDASVRASAARAAGVIGDPVAMSALLARLQDPDILVGDRIVESIAMLDAQGATPVLRAMLNSPDEALQARAAYGLGLLHDEASVPQLRAMLLSGKALAARRAAEALGTIGTPDALSALIAPLASSEATPARHAAMGGIEIAGKPAVGPLVAALRADSPELRANAAEALGWLRPIEATTALAASLSDEQPEVRTQAAWALGQIATDDARAALSQAKRVENNASTEAAIESALLRTETVSRGGAAPISLGSAWLAALSELSPTRWTLLLLVSAAALALLFTVPQDPAPQVSRRRHSR